MKVHGQLLGEKGVAARAPLSVGDDDDGRMSVRWYGRMRYYINTPSRWSLPCVMEGSVGRVMKYFLIALK